MSCWTRARDFAGAPILSTSAASPSTICWRRTPSRRPQDRAALIGSASAARRGGSALDVEDEAGETQGRAVLHLGSLRQTLRDYATICDSYHEAIRTAPRSRIEAIDMGRRACHNDGAEIIRRELASSIDIDDTTARRLFTLVYALHVRV